MIRKLLMLGSFVGISAALPMIYQSNPQAFDAMLKSAVQSTREDRVLTPEINIVDVSQSQSNASRLGRKVIVTQDALGHFTAPFKLNGRKVDALIDTGATLVAINSSTARKIGISLKMSDYKHEVNTANGSLKGAFVTIKNLQIGKINLNNVKTIVLDDKALRTNLIGMSFLSRLTAYKAESGAMLLEQ